MFFELNCNYYLCISQNKSISYIFSINDYSSGTKKRIKQEYTYTKKFKLYIKIKIIIKALYNIILK